MTDVLVDRPSTDMSLDDGSGDPENLTHIVDQRGENRGIVARAIVEGFEVTALCGHRFIPYRRVEQFPVCKRCRDILAEMD